MAKKEEEVCRKDDKDGSRQRNAVGASIKILNIGTLKANVTRALNKEFDQSQAGKLSSEVRSCLQKLVRQASITKRECQRAIAQYIERLSTTNVDETDRTLLDKLCPRVKGEADDDDDEAEEDGDTIDPRTCAGFLSCLLNAIYNR
ncbi:hypothetical protein EDD11_000910, partial [Mortierella claussenii]